MLRNTSLLFVIFLWLQLAHIAAQDTEEIVFSDNRFHAEGTYNIFANTVTLSYEKHIGMTKNQKAQILGRVGLRWRNAHNAIVRQPYNGYGLVVGTSFIFAPTKPAHFELYTGVGLEQGYRINDTNSDPFMRVFYLVDVGFRYQQPEGGLIFRTKAGLSGLGLGIGYAIPVEQQNTTKKRKKKRRK